jgi:aldose 1-epimerase
MTQIPAITQAFFGTTPNGEEASLYTLTNSNGMTVKISNFGGVITSILVPDVEGNFADVALGFDELTPYLKDSPYLGALIGRFGNRIANGRFELNGQVFQLDTNDGSNHLHGGFVGFDKVVWTPVTFETTDKVGLRLSYLSPNGDQGYPGNLHVNVTYILTNDNEIVVDYLATTDQPTPVNLTQHSYFNLAAEGDVLNHQVMIKADNFTPINANLIPLGESRAVEGGVFDFRSPKKIGEQINNNDEQLKFAGGYDHNFVLNKSAANALDLAARVVESGSGRVLEVYTEEPGVQFYSGNFLDGSLTGKGKTYSIRTGFCLEPQHFPDAPNQPDFPSTILQPGDEYTTRTIFKFLTTRDL